MEYSINARLWGQVLRKETLKSEKTLPEYTYPSQLVEKMKGNNN